MTSRFRSSAGAYAMVETKILLRAKTPIIFMFVVPAFLSAILGPAVSGLSRRGADGRAAVGFAVLFSYMVVNYAGLALFREYWAGTWVRQAALEPPRAAYLVGKLLPVCVLGLVQLSVFGLFAFVFLDLPMSGNPVQLLLVAIALVSSGAGIGSLLFSMTRNASSFQSLTYLILIAFGALGGAIVISSKLPTASRIIGYATPQYWALHALNESTFGKGSWGPTFEALGVIGAVSLITLTVAARRFDYKKQKSGLV